MSRILQCPHRINISGLQQGCMIGKFPADCINCDCEDKYWVDVRITTSTTDTIDGKYENTSFSIPFEKNKMKNKMNIRKAKKLYKAGTLFKVEGTNVVGMSLGCNRKNEIDSFNLIDILTGESVKRCDGKCRLATKKEQRLYFASLRAIILEKQWRAERWE